MDIINTTRNIQWSKVAADIQVMFNQTVVRTGTFVSEKIWASDLVHATTISLLFLICYWSIIYLDSSHPGIDPPSPLAVISRKKVHHQGQALFHLNYLLGIVITLFIFFSLFFHIF